MVCGCGGGGTPGDDDGDDDVGGDGGQADAAAPDGAPLDAAPPGPGWVIASRSTGPDAPAVSIYAADVPEVAILTYPGRELAGEARDAAGEVLAVAFGTRSATHSALFDELAVFADGQTVPLGATSGRVYQYAGQVASHQLVRDWDAADIDRPWTLRAVAPDGAVAVLATCDARWSVPGDSSMGDTFVNRAGPAGLVFGCASGTSDSLHLYDGTTVHLLPGDGERWPVAFHGDRVVLVRSGGSAGIATQRLSSPFEESIVTGTPSAFGAVGAQGILAYTQYGNGSYLFTANLDGTGQTLRLESEESLTMHDISDDGVRFMVTGDRAWAVPFDPSYAPMVLHPTAASNNRCYWLDALPDGQGYLGFWSLSRTLWIPMTGQGYTFLGEAAQNVAGTSAGHAIMVGGGLVTAERFDGSVTHVLSDAASDPWLEVRADGLVTFADDAGQAWIAAPDPAVLKRTIDDVPTRRVVAAGQDGERLFFVLHRTAGHADIVLHDRPTGASTVIVGGPEHDVGWFLADR